ncbi:MAG TPA: CatB-related O-acetyltransferase [Magnetovibrio sp.]
MAFDEIPRPNQRHPLPDHDRLVFVNTLNLPDNVEVGDYTYYDDPAGAAAFQANILYHFDFTGDRLVIGKFCAIAAGTKFLMNGGNHRVGALSTFPFMIFGGDWAERFDGEATFPNKGDTVIGNDVWMGWNCTILPGVRVGDGAVIAACAVVVEDVPPYAVVAGNPARVVKMRFDAQTVAALLDIRWWEWPVEKITRHLPAISGDDIEALKKAAQTP